jgi:hypothetical protein
MDPMSSNGFASVGIHMLDEQLGAVETYKRNKAAYLETVTLLTVGPSQILACWFQHTRRFQSHL